jgi:hypothetical protein
VPYSRLLLCLLSRLRDTVITLPWAEVSQVRGLLWESNDLTGHGNDSHVHVGAVFARGHLISSAMLSYVTFHTGRVHHYSNPHGVSVGLSHDAVPHRLSLSV